MSKQLLNKISVKNVVGKIKATVKSKDAEGDDIMIVAERPIMRVIGIATKKEAGSSDFGEFIAFIGNFEATNLLTGEIYRGGKLFLPDVASNLLDAAVSGEHVTGVEFGFDIGVKPRPDLPIGYEYTASPLIDSGEADPLAVLATKVTAALPAPAKDEEKTAAKK